MKNVLFVCTGNTCRSPMAEGIFNNLCKQKGLDMTSLSAGVCAMTGDEPTKNAVLALSEINIDISKHRSRKSCAYLFEWADLVVPMTYDHAVYLIQTACPKEKIFLPDTPVFDPYGAGIDTYRKCREQLMQLCSDITEKLNDN